VARAQVQRELYDLLATGEFVGGDGKVRSARNHLILLTTNTGERLLGLDGAPATGAALEELLERRFRELGPTDVDQALREKFSDAFVRRMGPKVLMRPLNTQGLREIANREIEGIRSHFTERGVDVQLEPRLMDLIVAEGFRPREGASPVKEAVERMVNATLLRAGDEGHLREGQRVLLDVDLSTRSVVVREVGGTTGPVELLRETIPLRTTEAPVAMARRGPIGFRVEHRMPGAGILPVLKAEVAGAGHFAAAYLVKEAFQAVTTGDPRRVRDAIRGMGEPGFWGSLGLFSVAARVATHGVARLPLKGFTRSLAGHALPLAAGMAAVEVVMGERSWKRVLVGTGSFLVAGAAVSLVADAVIYPMLFAAGPPGWIAAGIYGIAKMAATLYLGERLEHWAMGLFRKRPRNRHPQRPSSQESSLSRRGIRDRIDAIGEGTGQR
jgi:hypothetical protein